MISRFLSQQTKTVFLRKSFVSNTTRAMILRQKNDIVVKQKQDVNYSQHHIEQQIINYLKLQNREAAFINRFGQGHCLQFTTLALHNLWLENQPKDTVISKHGTTWYWDILTKISEWDGKTLPSPQDQQDFDNLINYLESTTQNNQDVITAAHRETALTQLSLAKFKREYSLGGYFTARDFIKPIRLTHKETSLFHEIVKEGKMIFLFIHDHVLGLFFNGQQYYFYDINNTKGIKSYSQSEIYTMIQKMFKKSDADSSELSPFGILVFSSGEEAALYPTQYELLSAIISPSLIRDISPESARDLINTIISAECVESLNFFISQGLDIDAACYCQAGPLSTTPHPILLAAYTGNVAILKTLANFGADLTIIDKKYGNTVAHCAVYSGNKDIISLLALHEAPLNQPNRYGITPAQLAVANNKVDMLNALATHGVNLNQCDSNGNTLAHWAAKHHNPKMIELLARFDVTLDKANSDGQTPLDIANETGDTTTIMVLEYHLSHASNTKKSMK